MKYFPTNTTRLAVITLLSGTAWLAGVSTGAPRQFDPSAPTARDSDNRAGPDWWSLQPIQARTPPATGRNERQNNAIDAFVQDKLAAMSLESADRANRSTLLRRAKFDLLGLPPTPDELDQFTRDPDPDAFERWVDRFLASPHYGERWGRHWLDVVRFGESDGFENDKLREHAWRYRDYVIDSLNRDRPYDRFVREQLAGDCLDPITRESIVATGFLVAGPWDEIQFVAKSAVERLRAREEQQEELIATIGQTFLGLTVNCARCHDHKFDPIPQTDYYALKAVFDGVDHRTGDATMDSAQRGTRPILTPVEQRDHESRVEPIRNRVGELKKRLAEANRQVGSHAVVAMDDPGKTLTAGKFARALNPRAGHAESAPNDAYHTPPLTVECWANVASKTGFNILVASQPKESASHWELYSYIGSGEFSVYMPGYEPAEIKSGTDITDGQWHYLAMTFDGTHVRLFVDARPVREAVVKRVKQDGLTGPLWFGGYPPHKIGCDGAVDEVRISNTVREVVLVPASPFSPDPDTIGLWHFDALAGRVVRNETDFLDESAFASAQRLQEELTAAERELASLAAAVPVTYAGVRRQPEPTRLFARGDIQKPAAIVAPASLTALEPVAGRFNLSAESLEAHRRAQFALWLTEPRNPLIARVMVNRIWHYHFGRGIVETPSDFGWNAGQPSHPELLDWLADQFIQNRFSIKQMHRLIMASHTYQQSSDWNPRAGEIDSDNRWLWRFTPKRLEAEVIRDSMLATSGEWNAQIGGPSFRPFTTSALLTQFYHLLDDGRADFNRRTIYRINVNTAKDPLLDSLDCPAPSVAAPSRRTTTTPVQALALMNDSFVMRQADRFADRLRHIAGSDPNEQVRTAVLCTFGREPAAAELTAIRRLAVEHGLEYACWTLLNSSEFLHVR